MRTRIEEISTCASRAAATGTVTVTNSEATFAGDGTSRRQVFNVDRNLGSATRQIGLVFTGIPAGATVVVNVLPDDAIINTYTGTGLPGTGSPSCAPGCCGTSPPPPRRGCWAVRSSRAP
ncbi:choice-of-anchor A family protein [Kitasatospora aburaviensis]